jgi:hypothetical protein
MKELEKIGITDGVGPVSPDARDRCGRETGKREERIMRLLTIVVITSNIRVASTGDTHD